MLTHLSVRDLAVVETVSIELHSGMTVMTGETGAGKSILVDALALALGARASAQWVRQGAERAEVTALFDIQSLPEVRALAAQLELDDGDTEVHLRRTITADGRSRGYVNGRPVPVQTLKDFGTHLADVHGQSEHQTLLSPAVQRELLDAFGAHKAQCEKVAKLFDDYQDLSMERDALLGGTQDADARRALLEYQVEELDELAPQPNEFEITREELGKLSRAGQRLEDVDRAQQALTGDDGADTHVHRALSLVSSMAEDYPAAAGAAELLESAVIHINEAASQISDLAAQLDVDPERLTELEQRLDQLHSVARKHRVEPEELLQIQTDVARELETLVQATGRLRELDSNIDQARDAYLRAAKTLSKARAKAAIEFGKKVTQNMAELGMTKGQCLVDVQADANSFSRHGQDSVEFLVSANPGLPPGPLRKVASGGELSRISLAIQVILAAGSGVPTLVFDEVDVGVGGRVAEIVGKRLRDVASVRQVLCITHLPQVAAQGETHLRIEKQLESDTSSTLLAELDAKARVDEIARMLGGIEITERTLDHAREMLGLA